MAMNSIEGSDFIRPVAVHRFCAKPPFAGGEADVQLRSSLARDLLRATELLLVCPTSGGAMCIIAFITTASTVRDILAHLGEPIAPPRIAPARGPPLWEAADAERDSPPDPALQPAPAYEFDQRLTW
jgi:hypothetical protein